MIALIGLIIGLLIGLVWNVVIPSTYSTLTAVVILAAADAVLGGIVANMRQRFNTRLFLSGFASNVVISLTLAILGNQLDVPLSLAAVFAFGNRIFLNISRLRRLLLLRYDDWRLTMRLGKGEVTNQEEVLDVMKRVDNSKKGDE